MDDIKKVLRSEGLLVEATSYGACGLLPFLLHSKTKEAYAIKRVSDDIAHAIDLHKPENVSIIAHSYGMYLFSKMLRARSDWTWNRIIFCGSIVEDSFPLSEVKDRFSIPLLNEVGGRDRWPAIAEKFGYGGGRLVRLSAAWS